MVKTSNLFLPAYPLLLIIIMLAGFVSADFELLLETESVDAELNSGSFMELGAQIINNGGCPLDCLYERSSFEGDDFSARIPGMVPPNSAFDFVISLMVPGCEEPASCGVPILVVCKEEITDECPGGRFVVEKFVSFTNVQDAVPERTENPLNVPDETSDPRITGDSYDSGSAAKFEAIPELSEMDSLTMGETSSNTVVLANRDTCPMRCVYKVQGEGYEEELISERIPPGSKASFNLVFAVPEFCRDSCNIVSHIVCYQLPDIAGTAYCNSNNVYESEVSFALTNVLSHEEETLAFIILGVLVVGAAALLYLGYRFASQRLGGSQRRKDEEEGRRKLSAIIFTDMKGFSREVGRDEEATLKKMWRYEKVMKQIIKEHQGRVVKTIGDAIMGDFDSAVNAVRAAVAIQDLLKKEDIKIRVGIHLGDVIHKGGDIFGDGVNIASRLESICEPGEIYISEDVYNQVRGKIRVDFESLGRKPLKNIEVPPKVFRIKA